jgi:hypothetical protein
MVWDRWNVIAKNKAFLNDMTYIIDGIKDMDVIANHILPIYGLQTRVFLRA